MIKPNRKNKKKYQFNPIETQKHQISSGVSEDQQESNLFQKLNSSSSKVRQQITSILANMTIFPQEIKDKAVLKQLLVRVVDDKITISYNALFALNNIIRNDSSCLVALSELGILDAVTSYLKKIPEIQNVKTARRVLQGAYLLVQTILTTLTFDQLRYLQKTQNMNYILTFALQSISTPILHDCQILFQVIAYIAQYSKLRKVIGESKIPQTIFLTISNLKVKALLSNILLFSGSQLSQKVIDEIGQFINQTMDSINLQKQYKSNILQEQPKEQEIDMEAQVNDGGEEFQEIDEEKVIETEKQNQPITNQIFLDSLETLEIVSNLLLSLVEENGEQEEIDEDEENMKQQEVEGLNCNIANQLKQKIKCTAGILQNSSLSLNEAEVLVDQSWRIIRNTLQVFNQQDLLKKSIETIEKIVQNKLPFDRQLLLSITETALQIIYKIWKKHPQSIKLPFTSLSQLTNYTIISQAGNKPAALIFDLVSLKYNPQQQPVSQNQNLIIGTNLRDFLMKSQSVQLQCQCLDTIFSVYSNENFDKTFSTLGYMQLLSQGLQALNGYKHKTKFTKSVQQDLIRFIEYKKQKLSQQKLL